MRKVTKQTASAYNAQQATFAQNFGKFFNEKKDWTDEMMDDLLEAFLTKNCCYISKRESFLSICGRSLNAIHDQLWKLGTNYNRKSVRKYTPKKRTNRTGRRFTHRDLAIIELATCQHGRGHHAHTPEYIGKLLGRNPIEIDNWMNRVSAWEQGAAFFDEREKGEPEDIYRARKVHGMISGTQKNVFDSLTGAKHEVDVP